MPPWLQNSFNEGGKASVGELFWRIGVAFLLGCVVAAIYKGTHRTDLGPPTFPRTLVLLSILIAMVTSVIGESVARAFSLVGALSIVRFRTVVRDTQDTAFVIFAVIVGMASGANHLGVALVGILVIGVAVFLLRPRSAPNVWSEVDNNLVIRVAVGREPESLAREALQQHVTQSEVLSVSTAKQGTAIEVNYRVRLKAGHLPADLVAQLNRTEGVLSVDLRQPIAVE